MGKRKTKTPVSYGSTPFGLEAADLAAAKSFGLLRDDIPISKIDLRAKDYGVAQKGKRNIGSEFYESQQAIQQRCKQFAESCGFQLIVSNSSSTNAKYVCKRLNGQQFFDPDISLENAQCPFFINVSGATGKWLPSKANFSHNHLRNVGFSANPFAKASIERPIKALRNTTQQIKRAKTLVETKMLPAHNGSTATMTGKGIASFLTSEGMTLGPSSISRIKTAIEEQLKGNRLLSFQKLEAYFREVEKENPGSVSSFEKFSDGTFFRACFLPSISIRVAQMSRRMLGFDGAHLKGEMNGYGVYLVATSKDYQKKVTPWAFALVQVENYDNWKWFLSVVQGALGELECFTIVSDRDKGLLSAVQEVFPRAGHRFCLEHIKRNICSARITLTNSERTLISSIADSDCENDFDLFRKELASTNSKAVEYLDGIKRIHRVKYAYIAHYKVPTYSEATSNLSEQANNWIGNECRSAKPLDAFGLYFLKLNERVSAMRQRAADWEQKFGEDELVPFLRDLRKSHAAASKYCEITPCLEGSYMVRFLGPTKRDGYIQPWRHVDLPARHCTCGGWLDFEFPCLHAVCAAIRDFRQLKTLYDSERLSIKHFNATYTQRFVPVPVDGQIGIDASLKLPRQQLQVPEKGKRGLKPGPKPKHKRRKTKGST